MSNPRIALIGAGYWGKNILRNLYQLTAISVLCEEDKDLLARYKTQYPDIDFTTDYKKILSNPNIDALAIATPAKTHYKYAKEALLSGKNVYVEKPLALKPEEAREVIDIAKENGKILMVGHILQYHPAIIKLKEIVKNGELGKIQYIYSNRLNIGKLRTEENILFSFAPHDVSVILSLVNEFPKKVFSFGGVYITQGIYDTTLTTMEFYNNIKAHIFVSWLHPYKEQKLIVVGSKAMTVFDDLTEEKLFIYPHKIEWKDGKIPIAQKVEYIPIPVPKKEPLKEELKHFIHCITTREEPLTNGEEGLRVLKVLNKAEESLKLQDIHKDTKNPDYFIHSSSYIDKNVIIGKGTKIWHFSHILSNTKIGQNCVIGQNCMIGPDVKIGNTCKIQNNVSIYKGVILEDNVFCGPSMVFTNVLNPRAFIERKNEFKYTLVKRGATIGANATIVCGNTIGKYALIGAGALVTKDVPDYALMLGVPAKQKGWVCECGEVLTREVRSESQKELICPRCRSRYVLKSNDFCPVKK